MRIKRVNKTLLMSEGITCSNYFDMKHFNSEFEKISDNTFKCKTCGTTLIVQYPSLEYDESGRLKMQVAVTPKK